MGGVISCDLERLTPPRRGCRSARAHFRRGRRARPLALFAPCALRRRWRGRWDRGPRRHLEVMELAQVVRGIVP